MQREAPTRLRELRLARGLTQQQLAMELSLAQNTLSRYEHGLREMGYQELINVADFFHVSIDYLLKHDIDM